MFKNYITISARHLWRHKSHVLINLAGLGVGLAICILAYLTWKFDQDFDRFHTKADQLYLVTTIKQSNQQEYGLTPIPLAEAAEQLTNVEAGICIDIRSSIISNGKDSYGERVTFVESDFLTWFDFPLALGTADLEQPKNLLITERMAHKYFGQSNPIGQTLTLYPQTPHQRELTITGVLKNLPLNSSLQFDFLTNMDNQFNDEGERINTKDWTYLANITFLALKNVEASESVREQLQSYIPIHNQVHTNWEIAQFRMQPVKDMAQHANDVRWTSIRPNLNDAMVWGTALTGIILLLTACLNFTNMMMSLASKRLKEIGIRKVMGSSRQQLILQLLMEGFLMSIASLGVGILFLKWMLPYYNSMWREIELQLTFVDNLPIVGFVIGMVLLTTLLSTAYPAFYISGFSPTHIFRGKTKFAGANLFSRTLLGIQVVSAMIGLVIGLTFSKNAQYQQDANLGFQKEGIQIIRTASEQTYLAMHQAAQQSPLVESVGGVRYHMGDGLPTVEFNLRGTTHEVELMQVSNNYLKTMDIQIADGRDFKPTSDSDYETNVLVNEKFVAAHFPNENPIGQSLVLSDTLRYNIVGVTKDFMQYGFFQTPVPMMIKLDKADRFRYLVLHSDPTNMLAVQDYMEAEWKQKFPYQPFVLNWQYDFMNYGFQITENIKKMTLTTTIISIFLMIAGFASLLAMDILKRLKEITIRRILGARATHVAYLLGNRFLLIVLLSLVVGGFLGLWISKMALDEIYAVHIGIQASTIVIAALAMLSVVFLTVAGRLAGVLKNAPAETLSSE